MRYEILRALHQIGGDGGAFVPSEILAEATGIPLQEVTDRLELLGEEDKVRFTVSSSGSAAYMQPRGRLYLKEMPMPKKQSTSMPKKIFITHGRSGVGVRFKTMSSERSALKHWNWRKSHFREEQSFRN